MYPGLGTTALVGALVKSLLMFGTLWVISARARPAIILELEPAILTFAAQPDVIPTRNVTEVCKAKSYAGLLSPAAKNRLI